MMNIFYMNVYRNKNKQQSFIETQKKTTTTKITVISCIKGALKGVT